MNHRLPRPASLRARMTLGFTLSFAAFVLIACTGILLWSRMLDRRAAGTLAHDAALLMRQEWDGQETSRSLQRGLYEVGEEPRLSAVAVRIIDPAGKTVVRSNHRALPPWPLSTEDNWLMATVPLGRYTVVAGMKADAADAALRQQALVLILLSLCTIAVAAGCSWVLVGRTLRPIVALSDQASRAAAKTAPLSACLAPPSEDTEVRHLVGTLNRMLERMREDNRAREQFYAAAAHELRTPLAVLSGGIEVALSRSRSGAEYRETLADLQQETRRLIALAENVLALNRLDLSTGEERETVDVVAVCAQTIAETQTLLRERHLRLETDFPECEVGCRIAAPPAHVLMLLRNLIENAVKYATPGGTVTVALRSDTNRLLFSVTNTFSTPESLPPLERLAEPFFRGEMSEGAPVTGNGLGLTLCRRIVTMNGWTLHGGAQATGVFIRVGFGSDLLR